MTEAGCLQVGLLTKTITRESNALAKPWPVRERPEVLKVGRPLHFEGYVLNWVTSCHVLGKRLWLESHALSAHSMLIGGCKNDSMYHCQCMMLFFGPGQFLNLLAVRSYFAYKYFGSNVSRVAACIPRLKHCLLRAHTASFCNICTYRGQ